MSVVFFFSCIVSSKYGKEVNLDWGENIGRGEEGEDRDKEEEDDLRSK